MMNISKLMNFEPIKDLNESIAYVHEKNSKLEYPRLSEDKLESIDSILLNCYRESKLISITYRNKGKIASYTGMIERIDLIYRELFLSPKKKISFQMIVGIKDNSDLS